MPPFRRFFLDEVSTLLPTPQARPGQACGGRGLGGGLENLGTEVRNVRHAGDRARGK